MEDAIKNAHETEQESEQELEHEYGLRARLLYLWEKMADPLSKLFLGQNVLVPELEKILRWRATQAALNDPAFAMPGRDIEYQQTFSHAAVLTGLSRQEMAEAARSNGSPVDVSGGSLHRMIRVLTGWRTDPGFQDENGNPIDLPLRGPAPSFHALCYRYGRDTPTRPIADALVKNGNAIWTGAGPGNRRGKYLRYVHPVVTGDLDSPEEVGILTQVMSDFLHAFKQMFERCLRMRPRFREGYFNDISAEKADAAQAELHAEIQNFDIKCTEILKKYRAKPGEAVVRLGAGAYSFRDAPFFLNNISEQEDSKSNNNEPEVK